LLRGVTFRDLGLLVVDEEQRFGVNQKEKNKIAANAMLMSLSAPLRFPHTLHGSEFEKWFDYTPPHPGVRLKLIWLL